MRNSDPVKRRGAVIYTWWYISDDAAIKHEAYINRQIVVSDGYNFVTIVIVDRKVKL